MKNDSLPGSNAGHNLNHTIVTMADLPGRRVRATVPNNKDGPTLTAPEERAARLS
jgi:hypothetical protein